MLGSMFSLGLIWMKQIASRENPAYKFIGRLVRSRRARREQGMIVLDGVHLVCNYLERFGAAGLTLVIRKSASQHSEIKVLAERATCVLMSDSLFDRVAPVQSPVGVLAMAPLPKVSAPDGPGFQVLLDGIQHPGNVGAILRTAAAASALGAHLSKDCADPWSPKCLRGGM